MNFEKNAVTIAQSITERMEFKAPKNDRSRTITMPDALRGTLREHQGAQESERRIMGKSYKDQSLVFAHADGSAIDPWNFASSVRDLVKRAGVTPITLHGLRDTHASLMASAGVAIEVISQRLGHSSIGITVERYLHVYSNRDADAAAAFGRLVG